MSALLKAGGILRVIQLLLGILIIIIWAWLRSGKFGTADGFPIDDDEKKFSNGFGNAFIALSIFSAILAIVVSAFNLQYCIRSHYTQHRLPFHVVRFVADIVVVSFISAALGVFNRTPNWEFVYSTDPEVWKGPSYTVLRAVGIFGQILLILVLGITELLIIVEGIKAHRAAKRGHNTQKGTYAVINSGPNHHSHHSGAHIPMVPTSYNNSYNSYGNGHGHNNGHNGTYGHV